MIKEIRILCHKKTIIVASRAKLGREHNTLHRFVFDGYDETMLW